MPVRIMTAVACLIFSIQALAAQIQDHEPLVKRYFTDMTLLGPLQGQPPVAEVFKSDSVIGYVFYTDDVVKIPAYSGKPIRTLVGFDTTGVIRGVNIVYHEEPILVVGITDADLQTFINQYIGKKVNDKIKVGGRDRDGYRAIDTISGATITVMVLNATITRSLREIAQGHNLTFTSTAADSVSPLVGLDHIEPTEQAIWVYVWQERVFQIIVLSIGLFVLFLILVFQDWLAKHPTLLSYLRTGYLIWTVVFIGWYALAQLSIVNVLTFINSVFHDFSWENYLIDPMLFLLWGFVAMTLLLWGRGVYCGWLCPFGAMQELIFRIGELFKIKSYEVPDYLHRRLWAIKYLILLALFGISLQSLVDAERLAEVEPFKTAVTMRFQREWGYLLFAIGLLVASLFIRKFYCRYLCALGAALTFPARFRIFDWLLRRKECGRPCQICAQECEVQAIAPTGEINANECHYCLDCQVTYWNEYKCPPLVDKRKKHERFSKDAIGKPVPKTKI